MSKSLPAFRQTHKAAQAQGFPIHKFVEPVETNPDVTSPSAHPGPSPFDKLRVQPVELVETDGGSSGMKLIKSKSPLPPREG